MFDRNRLYFGDNLAFLSDPDEFPSESVDLVYLDPPFNSNASYNVLFKDAKGTPSAAQIKAFDDTWTWDQSANQALAQLMHDKHTPGELTALIRTFHTFLGHSPMLAYLVQMAVRLVHLRRVLKPTGSLYLHCDPTASHYLKLVLDGIFGPERFRNEIIWKRTSGHSDAGRFGGSHDTILFYSRDIGPTWNQIFQPYESGYVEKYYRYKDEDGRRFMSGDLSAAGLQGGGYVYDWKGVTREWRCPVGTMERLDEAGRIYYTRNGIPRLKRYLDESKGLAAQDLWIDIEALRSWHAERLGYPTQKPAALLKRIVTASSSPGDVILDPFCGCGTTIDAVETLNRENPDEPARRWIGIDITHLAINLIKSRLSRFDPAAEYEVIGEPVSVDGAQALFDEDPYQFQFWACGLVGARPAGSGGGKKGKKGADRGIDGERSFVDGNKGPCSMLVQVKGGKPKLADVRDFRGVIEREDAAVGIFVSLHEPTPKMRAEAAAAGTFKGVNDEAPVPRLQIVTVETLLQGGTPAVPSGLKLPRDAVGSSDVTLKRAKKHDDASLFQRRAKD